MLIATIAFLLLATPGHETSVKREVVLDLPHAVSRAWISQHPNEIIASTKADVVRRDGRRIYLTTDTPFGIFKFTCTVDEAYNNESERGLFTTEMVECSTSMVSAFRTRLLTEPVA